MDLNAQKRAPIYTALERFRKQRVVPFDVPGHKRGRGNPELVELLGERCVGIDVNSMKPLDNLCHPVSVIKEAEELAADAFGASHSFFMVGGTTSAVQAMILSACKAGDKIILPRNVHKSAINALVLCGAVPVYIDPKVDRKLGIPLGMEIDDVRAAMAANPDAAALLINNPTYYGICSDLKSLVALAHEHGMLALVDEAHGTHLYFGPGLPCSAMAAGADMAAVSMHKSGGSLTQSSLLLLGHAMNPQHIAQIINLTQTTSASYLLMASLDISRRNLALRGAESFAKVAGMAQYARDEINDIGGQVAGEKLGELMHMIRNFSSRSDVTVISGGLPRGVDTSYYREIFRTVDPHSLRIADTEGAKLFAALEAGIDLVKPNLEELQETLGREFKDKDDMLAGCRELLDRGAKMVLLSLGKDGAVITNGTRNYFCKSINVAVNSTVGAGDGMVAAAATMLQKGADLPDILRAGVAAGTATVTTFDTISFTKAKYEEIFASLSVTEF